jgi:hypothetical protein
MSTPPQHAITELEAQRLIAQRLQEIAIHLANLVKGLGQIDNSLKYIGGKLH